jgi:preprotein translocase subunit SecG
MFWLQTGVAWFRYYVDLRETETGKFGLMNSLTRNTIILALVFCCAGILSLSYSQTQTPKKASTASVSVSFASQKI